MKYCPACDRGYADEMRFCAADGSTLEIRREEVGARDHYVGRTIKGRYRIIQKLGEGGMGTVYLAEQVSIARKVALKLLQGAYARDQEFIERFRREARLAASLNHRNIITVYDFDQDDDGTLFIGMEYVDGRQLSDVIRSEGAMDIGRAVRLGVQMATGLEAAHKTGVIHRDIKPDNIMVLGSPGMEEIKLMDFGIARLRDTGVTNRLTRPDMIMGTPAYMAPEQAEGGEVSERTDIYSLGIVLYEMLSGSVPFKAATPGAVLMKQIQEKPLPLRKLRRTVSVPVERVVMQALEKKPQKRQQNVREVLQHLKNAEETIVGDEIPRTMAATLPLRATVIEKREPFKSKHVRTGLVALVLVMALASMVYWFTGSESLKAVSPKTNSLPIEATKTEETKTMPGEQTTPSKSSASSQRSEEQIGGLSQPRSGDKAVSPADLRADETRDRERTAAKITKPPGTSGPPMKPALKKAPEIEVKDTLSPPAPARESPVKDPIAAPRDEKRPRIKVGDNARVQEHLKVAKSFRERGDYADAIEELLKAASLDPTNKEVQADLEKTRKACNAERIILGRSGLKC
jgi:serine/threonine-protein kinase